MAVDRGQVQRRAAVTRAPEVDVRAGGQEGLHGRHSPVLDREVERCAAFAVQAVFASTFLEDRRHGLLVVQDGGEVDRRVTALLVLHVDGREEQVGHALLEADRVRPRSHQVLHAAQILRLEGVLEGTSEPRRPLLRRGHLRDQVENVLLSAPHRRPLGEPGVGHDDGGTDPSVCVWAVNRPDPLVQLFFVLLCRRSSCS